MKNLRQATLGVCVATLIAYACCRHVYALHESGGSGGSNTHAVHLLGQRGDGVKIAFIAGRNIRTTHEAFQDTNGVSHAFNLDFSGDGIALSSHDTQMAGIMASRGGALFPDEIGGAPEADVYCARVSDDNNVVSGAFFTNALKELIDESGCRVVVTGFELGGVAGDGESFWTLLYDYYAYEYGAVFANAAGNQNTLVTVFGDCYNGVTTGGLIFADANDQNLYDKVGSLSGRGPTDDGRRKPDITAPAQAQTVPTSGTDMAWTTIGTLYGETSYSVPHTAGVAALLLGAADATVATDDERPEVIKAAIVNSTFPNIMNKQGLPTNPADSNNTWNTQRGYGRIDALAAYQTLISGRITTDFNADGDKGWAFDNLAQGQQHSYTVPIHHACRLIATLGWQRRIDWEDEETGFPRRGNGIIEPGELHSYLADLDMRIFSPDEPNALFSEEVFALNEHDNLEKCDIVVTEPGDYVIVVINDSTNGESADYGLAFALHAMMLADLPPYDYIVECMDMKVFCGEWLSADSELDALFAPNGIVDSGDFAVFAPFWLSRDPAYHQ